MSEPINEIINEIWGGAHSGRPSGGGGRLMIEKKRDDFTESDDDSRYDFEGGGHRNLALHIATAYEFQ